MNTSCKALSFYLFSGMAMLPCSAFAVAEIITNFPDLVLALESGQDVRAIIHFNKCLLNDTDFQKQYAQSLQDASTRINLTEFSHYRYRDNGQLKDNVEAIDADFDGLTFISTFDTPEAILRIFDDNTGKFYLKVYDLSGSLLYNLIWTCDISNGQDDKGLVLFNGF